MASSLYVFPEEKFERCIIILENDHSITKPPLYSWNDKSVQKPVYTCTFNAEVMTAIFPGPLADINAI